MSQGIETKLKERIQKWLATMDTIDIRTYYTGRSAEYHLLDEVLSLLNPHLNIDCRFWSDGEISYLALRTRDTYEYQPEDNKVFIAIQHPLHNKAYTLNEEDAAAMIFHGFLTEEEAKKASKKIHWAEDVQDALADLMEENERITQVPGWRPPDRINL